MSAKINSLILNPTSVEKVKPPLRGRGVPLMTSNGTMGIPTFLHPLTYSAEIGSAKGGFKDKIHPRSIMP